MFLKTRFLWILTPCAKHRLSSWMIVMHDGLLEFSRELVQGNESMLWFWSQTEPGLFPAQEPAALEQGSTWLAVEWLRMQSMAWGAQHLRGVSVQCEPSVIPRIDELLHDPRLWYCITDTGTQRVSFVTGWKFWSNTNPSNHICSIFLSNWLQVYWHQSNPHNSCCIASWGVPAAKSFKGDAWEHVQFNSLG